MRYIPTQGGILSTSITTIKQISDIHVHDVRGHGLKKQEGNIIQMKIRKSNIYSYILETGTNSPQELGKLEGFR